MSPIGERFVPEEFRAEPPKERPVSSEPLPARQETHSNLVSLAAERKRRRELDARASVDVALRTAGGNLDAVRQHVEQRLKEARAKIDSLERFDHAAQEESEFLKAQRDAILERMRQPAEIARPEEPKEPVPAAKSPEPKEPSLLDRIRSGWNRLKARLFDSDAAAPYDRSKKSAYEQTWTEDRLSGRGPAREAERARLKEHAVETLLQREWVAQERLSVVRNILAQRGIVTRQRREAIPEPVRTRYAQEQARLESSLRDIRAQLRIAEATRRTDESERLRA